MKKYIHLIAALIGSIGIFLGMAYLGTTLSGHIPLILETTYCAFASIFLGVTLIGTSLFYFNKQFDTWINNIYQRTDCEFPCWWQKTKGKHARRTDTLRKIVG